MKCNIDGCLKNSCARGLCSKHYQAAKISESLPGVWAREQRKPKSLAEKLENSKQIDESTGCWEWTGRTTDDGYGRVPLSKSRWGSVHRLSYEMAIGEIPEGLELDHLCRNRKCFNPSHLEPVTRKENVLRGDLPKLMKDKAKQQTHCYKGHPLSGDNLVLQGPEKQYRVCRECRSERQRRKYHDSKSKGV